MVTEPSFDFIELFGLKLLNARRAEVSAYLIRSSDGPKRLAFVNAHCVNMMMKDAEYRRALGSACMLLPDGAGISISARLRGRRFVDNLNGTDLFPLLCFQAAAAGQSMYLLGAMPGVAATAADAMRHRIPGVVFAGTQHGYFGEAEEHAVIARINDSGADVLLVATGVPHQDLWLARNQARLRPRLILGVGGLFDYYSTRTRRAPLWMREAGMEWCWRLCQEPQRLAKRYLIGNPVFLVHAAKDALRSMSAPARGSKAG